MAFTAAYDLLTMRIPNWISLVLIVAFLGLSLWVGMPLETIGWHFATAILVLIVTFLLFIPGWIGGGDAKVAASISLWMGMSHTVDFLLISAVFGGALTVLILLFRNYVPLPMVPNWRWLTRLHEKTVGVPYGIALAIAGLLVYSDIFVFEQLLLG